MTDDCKEIAAARGCPIENEIIELAAEAGARRALEKLGLTDPAARDDIRNLRDMISVIRMSLRTAMQAAVKWATIGVIGLLVAGLFSVMKTKIFGGP